MASRPAVKQGMSAQPSPAGSELRAHTLTPGAVSSGKVGYMSGFALSAVLLALRRGFSLAVRDTGVDAALLSRLWRQHVAFIGV